MLLRFYQDNEGSNLESDYYWLEARLEEPFGRNEHKPKLIIIGATMMVLWQIYQINLSLVAIQQRCL